MYYYDTKLNHRSWNKPYTLKWKTNETTRYFFIFFSNNNYIEIGYSNCRKVGNTAYKATTWQIIFELKSVMQSGSYTLQIALASATNSELQVYHSLFT